MKNSTLAVTSALLFLGVSSSLVHAQTFDTSFETSDALPTLTLDLDGVDGNESFDAVAEGLTPFTLVGPGSASLVTGLDAQDGNNFLLIEGQDMCLGFNTPLVASQQYEVCFYAAAWDHTKAGGSVVVTPVVDVHNSVSGRTWVNGNGTSAAEFGNFYTGGTFADYQNGTADYFNDISLSGTWNDATTITNDPNALDWSLYSFTFTATSNDEQAYISLLGGDNIGLALDNIKLNAVPEPSTGLLVVLSFGALALRRTRHHR